MLPNKLPNYSKQNSLKKLYVISIFLMKTNTRTLNSVNQFVVLKPIYIFENSTTKISMFIYNLLLIEKGLFWGGGLKTTKSGDGLYGKRGAGGGGICKRKDTKSMGEEQHITEYKMIRI